ncbi:hypothetical protein NDU88_004212 [Pleurodeles waltl]|uniref:Uncharacterized protein n=1 Tax=Pleurodeles waltl TaxID=8319 RepID=A0AAV7MB29_PLEWA|nr:hypothetical protein NDU88_004212 [Pleurodeles waltl]
MSRGSARNGCGQASCRGEREEQKAKGSGEAEPRGEMAPSDTWGKGSPAPRAAVPSKRYPSPDRGEEAVTPTGSRAQPSQVWSSGTEKEARGWQSPLAWALAPTAYKRGSLGKPYMVA